MQAADLEPFSRAIEEQICATCPMICSDGTCTQPRAQQCALAIHVRAVVESVLAVPEDGTTIEYRRAFGERMCEICPRDETGYCSLLELIGSATDDEVSRLAHVVRSAAK